MDHLELVHKEDNREIYKSSVTVRLASKTTVGSEEIELFESNWDCKLRSMEPYSRYTVLSTDLDSQRSTLGKSSWILIIFDRNET